MIKTLKLFCLFSFIFHQQTFAADQQPTHTELARLPQDLAAVKTKQIGKLAGFAVKENNTTLEKREKLILFKIQRWFSHMLNAEEQSLPMLCVASFFVGILTSLTPCIYPMIPVTAGILASSSQYGLLHQAAKSMIYVSGIATVHSGLGYFAATTGMIFGKWLSNPYVVLLLILFFLFLAFAMFGFYDVSLQLSSTDVPKGRSLFTTYFYGLLVGLASSPCLSPILVILLGFVGTMAEPLYGLALLFSFSMGVNMILMVVGFFTGVIAALPTPGAWMVEVKKILGFLMLFGCIYFAIPFLKKHEILALCGFVFFLAFIYYTYSANNERILSLIEHHNNSENSSVFFSSLPFRMIIKTLLSLGTLVAALYLGYTAFLVWRKITTIKLITKYFLR